MTILTLTSHRYHNYNNPVYCIRVKMRMIATKIHRIGIAGIMVAAVVGISIVLIIITQVIETEQEVDDMNTTLIGNIDESTLTIATRVCLEIWTWDFQFTIFRISMLCGLYFIYKLRLDSCY